MIANGVRGEASSSRARPGKAAAERFFEFYAEKLASRVKI